jgi:ATP-dependent RNA helicase RhlB
VNGYNTMTGQHLSDQRFSDFDLPVEVQQGIETSGFEFCTPIQAATIPILLEGRDVAGQAQTGTGKTAAFLIATFTKLLHESAHPKRKANQPRALILAPTRELAIQIHKDAVALNEACGFELGLVYGGVDYEKQRRRLREGVDILIGTPGRLIDYLKQNIFNLRETQALVLDEADRMFDLGFIKDLRFILRRCSKPEKRLNMLFSATLSFRVMELAYEHMNSPEEIEIKSEQVTADRVDQQVFYPANDEKIPLLLGVMAKFNPARSMVFTNTKRAAESVTAWLNSNGHKAALLSGDVPQNKRQRLLGEFKKGDYSVLVATDVAARGLHVSNIEYVFNFDLPQSAEDYVHRIGRTARAGKSGHAISFACEDTSFYLPEIEEYVGQKLPMGQVSDFLLRELKHPGKIARYGSRSKGGARNKSDRPRSGSSRGKPRRRNNQKTV